MLRIRLNYKLFEKRYVFSSFCLLIDPEATTIIAWFPIIVVLPENLLINAKINNGTTIASNK